LLPTPTAARFATASLVAWLPDARVCGPFVSESHRSAVMYPGDVAPTIAMLARTALAPTGAPVGTVTIGSTGTVPGIRTLNDQVRSA